MTRTGFTLGLAVVLILGATSAATAQPGAKAPPVVQFKQFGATPEQFWQSSVLRWTGQLSLDLTSIKSDIANAKLAPIVRAGINTQAENALLQTLELDQLVRKGAPKDKVFAAFADVEKSVAALAATVNQNPVAKQATAASGARADTAFHQLAAAVGAGDNNAERLARRRLRLAESTGDAAEDLRTLSADAFQGNEKALDRALGGYAREARSLARRLRDNADAKLIVQDYATMVELWSEAAALFGRVRNLPPAVQAQATRVDDLHRRLGVALGLTPDGPNPPPALPTAKRFSFVVGAGVGGQPHVTVFVDEKGTVAYSFLAYDRGFDGGVRVDMADLNGDRVPDLIVCPGPAKNGVTLPVRVYDGRDLNLLVEFVPFAGWKGGLHAVGTDLTKDGRALIAVTAEGTQHVKVFDLAQGKEIDSFFAHDQKVTGGVRLAWGDANGDGVPDLFAVNGPGNAVTTVKVFDGKNRAVLAEYPVLDNKYRGGAFVAAGDMTGNGRADAIIGLDAGTVPLVRVLDPKGKLLVEWLAYDERFKGGVRVALSARNHVVTGPGLGLKNSPVRIFATGNVKVPVGEIVPFLGYDGALNVGGR